MFKKFFFLCVVCLFVCFLVAAPSQGKKTTSTLEGEELIGLSFMINNQEVSSAYGSEAMPVKFGVKGKMIIVVPVIKDRKKQIVELTIMEDTEAKHKKTLEKTIISPEKKGTITVLPVTGLTVKLLKITRTPECSIPK